MGAETNVVSAIVSVLRTDQASAVAGSLGALGVTGVWHALAPTSAVTPYVTFQKMADTKQYRFKGGKRSAKFIFAVKAIDSGDDDGKALQIAARVDALLTDQALAVAAPTQWLETRLGTTLELPTREEGITYQCKVSNFEVWVNES